MKTWLFLDHWHIEYQDNLELCQGQPKWCPEATYEDPNFDHLELWPTVYKDQATGHWHGWHIGEHLESKLRRPLPKGEGPSTAVLMHTLRKDGFTYLTSRGGWASFISKPMVLKEPKLSINAQAPYGELRCQVRDMESRPLEGFSFEENAPFIKNDALDWELAWKGGSLTELVGKVVRLEFKFRHARLYALRGDFHFADAVDVTMIADGQPIDTTPFDF